MTIMTPPGKKYVSNLQALCNYNGTDKKVSFDPDHSITVGFDQFFIHTSADDNDYGEDPESLDSFLIRTDSLQHQVRGTMMAKRAEDPQAELAFWEVYNSNRKNR